MNQFCFSSYFYSYFFRLGSSRRWAGWREEGREGSFVLVAVVLYLLRAVPRNNIPRLHSFSFFSSLLKKNHNKNKAHATIFSGRDKWRHIVPLCIHTHIRRREEHIPISFRLCLICQRFRRAGGERYRNKKRKRKKKKITKQGGLCPFAWCYARVVSFISWPSHDLTRDSHLFLYVYLIYIHVYIL